MLLTPHVLIGGALGKVAGDPLLAFMAGLASHFVFDFIPHFDQAIWHPKNRNSQHDPLTAFDWITIWLDVALTLVIWSYILVTGHLTIPIFWGALGGTTPDLLDNVPFWKSRFRQTKFGNFFHQFHHLCHAHRLTLHWAWLGFLFALALSVIGLRAILR